MPQKPRKPMRTECLYNDETIGIESIFTVKDGRQLNIPGKVEELRRKSHNNELFCPCGCGANLVLVAGDRGLKKQHFRLKDKAMAKECGIESGKTKCECKTSSNSRVILKCWLDDKLHQPEIVARKRISAGNDNKKRELSLLDTTHKIAISYYYDRKAVEDDKIAFVEQNTEGIHLIYIADICNFENYEQYPEFMIKIQQQQGYCLFLSVTPTGSYYEARLFVQLYIYTDETWRHIEVCSGKLSDFDIDQDGRLIFENSYIADLLDEKKPNKEKESSKAANDNLIPNNQQALDTNDEIVQKPIKCPYCGGLMFDRNGRYGKFWVCSRCGKTLSDETVKKPCPKPFCRGYLIETTGNCLRCIKCNSLFSFSSYKHNRYR